MSKATTVKQPIEHRLSPAWAKHLAEVRQQIQQAEQQNWIFKGQIAHNEQEIAKMKAHHATTLAVILEAENLPKPIAPYQLSEDGGSLIGEIEVAEVIEMRKEA